MAAVAVPAVLWCLAIMGLLTDRRRYRMFVCACCAAAAWMMETTQFGQHDNLIHVQHNDGTGACINMSLASSLWSHTQDTMTAHIHIPTRKHAATGSVITVVSGHSLVQLTNIPSRHPGKQRWWSRLFVITVTDDSCTHVIISIDNYITVVISACTGNLTQTAEHKQTVFYDMGGTNKTVTML